MKTILLLLFFVTTVAFGQQVLPYKTAAQPWPEQLGNHRAVIEIKPVRSPVKVVINWRRHDVNPNQKALIITNEFGDQVKNIFRIQLDKEKATLVFEPEGKSTKYYIYYLPWKGDKGTGYFNGEYLKPEAKPDESWVSQHQLEDKAVVDKLPQAKVLYLESRTAFDSFYPMEVAAKQSEISHYVKKNPASFLLFPENRRNPIRMANDIPIHWLQRANNIYFSDNALKNEYFAFQIGTFANQADLENLEVTYKNAPYPITCFNTGGTNAKGKTFKKQLDVIKGKVQALWFGLDIPKNATAGIKTFQVIVKAKNLPAQTITVKLNILNKEIKDRGDSELWRHSRLRWLNSTLGIDDEVVLPYTKLTIAHKTIQGYSGKVELNDTGFPAQVYAKDQSILSAPITFKIDNNTETFQNAQFKWLSNTAGKIAWQSVADNQSYTLTNQASMEFDGYLHYKITIMPKQNLKSADVKLQIPVQKQQAAYFMGMGLPGSLTPDNYNWKWKGPQDAYWIGTADAGLFCEMRGATYSGPLLNLYHPAPPPSWYNNNHGGFSIHQQTGDVICETYTGEQEFIKDKAITFEFALLITPVKPLNTPSQFTDRYYHNGSVPNPPESALSSGIKFTNVHHANLVNPYINYPFIRADSIKNFAAKWHKKGLKTKIYYTIRELSNQATELWALRSLGNEVLADGKGGGFMWLREHLEGNYDAQWFTPINGSAQSDAALLTSGESRWYNYYIEGLKWMIENTDIDGLYLDDVAFDRNMLKRMRKVMDRAKPGCIIDLHSNTGFSKGPATQYTEFFPYINKLWFGESFVYDKMPPENWLVESSGIPFGLMGDMLHAGGNPWRGMVYGMTVRFPWFTEGVNCDPREIWKIWDSFGIANAKMIGYWDQNKIVTTSDTAVLATAYLKKDELLISVASWNKNPKTVKLNIDWKKVGWEPEDTIAIPAIDNFQTAKTLHLNDPIEIEPIKGYLLIIKKKR